MIIGPSGTGKEVTASTIQRLSRRRDQPFITVNCGAISATLIESELFGHEKGAFTGADRRRKGLFEQADGGKLFLDEVTEMPIDLQVRLLRVLRTVASRGLAARKRSRSTFAWWPLRTGIRKKPSPQANCATTSSTDCSSSPSTFRCSKNVKATLCC